MPEHAPQDVLARAAGIRLVIFDVDGVLTDGRLFFDQQGQEYKSFHARDGHGIKLLQGTGVATAVISGRRSQSVALRMESLGIRHVYQGYQDKLDAFEHLRNELALAPDEIAHVGDDLLDLPIMRRVGLAVAVADAHFSIRQHAHWVTPSPGGAGAAREVCDLVMKAQGTLQGVIESHF
ncbi:MULTISPECIES: 3-deoxy-manno-octulosonate-8-phosphatase KdsC [Methylocaldum]|jgi:3-deoxy-D-manno-octulosonate 8-phosphate phosphatase (KDO 8-P phosphatase)|uniref:3-deoxy-manno-octulosonate-8-phosphatase KdsC n=1 Tax=unclassified Methylocaldum TaxID=2622260 RepID=UPI00098AB1BC|nr:MULTISPECIES: 3-deoxy-manno-octulosonate-8-phosphatase KdsC [unclassified Methylocaldum]MBP1148900.1 3-deoxy-D-manno-octulosonate 8-phosphate phosphatase (KDO 8-P phosphatase) [Methylocaldum sp. RMAD-M]MVF20633.1 3-deoxy-manno-octulosonate-8-phosphatase KdsC [Methylocaldum sp. BRCS4]